jgi:hypothetical protein
MGLSPSSQKGGLPQICTVLHVDLLPLLPLLLLMLCCHLLLWVVEGATRPNQTDCRGSPAHQKRPPCVTPAQPKRTKPNHVLRACCIHPCICRHAPRQCPLPAIPLVHKQHTQHGTSCMCYAAVHPPAKAHAAGGSSWDTRCPSGQSGAGPLCWWMQRTPQAWLAVAGWAPPGYCNQPHASRPWGTTPNTGPQHAASTKLGTQRLYLWTPTPTWEHTHRPHTPGLQRLTPRAGGECPTAPRRHVL